MEQKSFQSFLNKILPEYPDDLIQPTYQEIFEGLDKEQKNFLGQILLDNPKIIVAYVYSYTPTKDYELRDELLKYITPRAYKLIQKSNIKGLAIFDKELREFENGIIELSLSIPGQGEGNEETTYHQKLEDLSDLFWVVNRSDRIFTKLEMLRLCNGQFLIMPVIIKS